MKREILIDPRVPPSPGGVWNREGYRYTTLAFKLKDTPYLIHQAEGYRAENGLPPVIYWDEYTDEIMTDGYYDFWAEINDRFGDRFEVCIQYTVCYDEEDEKAVYSLPLTESEQAGIFRNLNHQSKTIFGDYCRKMLSEARVMYMTVKDYDLRLRTPTTAGERSTT